MILKTFHVFRYGKLIKCNIHIFSFKKKIANFKQLMKFGLIWQNNVIECYFVKQLF